MRTCGGCSAGLSPSCPAGWRGLEEVGPVPVPPSPTVLRSFGYSPAQSLAETRSPHFSLLLKEEAWSSVRPYLGGEEGKHPSPPRRCPPHQEITHGCSSESLWLFSPFFLKGLTFLDFFGVTWVPGRGMGMRSASEGEGGQIIPFIA